MKKSVWAVTGLMSLFALLYIARATGGASQPVLMTWLLFAVATSLSFTTYWAADAKRDWQVNIANSVDVVLCWLIFFFVLLGGRRVRLGLNLFEIGCLGASALIFWLWRRTRAHKSSNVALQLLMVVAYLPTYYQLWYARHNTEPLLLWCIVWVACAIALVPPWLKRDRLALLYAGRAFISVSINMALQLRLLLR